MCNMALMLKVFVLLFIPEQRRMSTASPFQAPVFTFAASRIIAIYSCRIRRAYLSIFFLGIGDCSGDV